MSAGSSSSVPNSVPASQVDTAAGEMAKMGERFFFLVKIKGN